MIRRTSTRSLTAIAALWSAACAGPITQIGSVSLEDVRAEQLHQQTLASQTSLLSQQRVARLAYPLLRAAAPLCGRDVRVAVRPLVSDASDVTSGATLDTLCAFAVTVQRDDAVNASADGRTIVLSSALLRFANDDELSVVLAHELAHNAMRHMDAVKKNAMAGGLLGAVADLAIAAAGGGNTGGQLAKQGAAAGAMAFSQDFEREADYVGLYILAWAGQPTDNAAQLWRRLAIEHPAEITFATTHPTTAERFVRLEQWQGEINRKIVSGSAFGPDVKDRQVAVVSRAASPLLSVPSSVASVDPTPSSVASRALVPVRSARTDVTAPRASGAVELQGALPARVTIGVALSAADRRTAFLAYEQGKEFLGSHHWGYAKARFREALRIDGSVAAYHAGLGEVFMVEHDWAGAAAEYNTALRLDADNLTYRARLNEARATMSY
ncbi:MAG: M48 family metalloprotease [bacterium]